jgi:dienelactone hydrolase
VLSRIIPFAALTALATVSLHSHATAASDEYATIFYRSGTLKIEAYLHKPAGAGPFPLVIYNHGNRGRGLERTEQPQRAVARLLTGAGYAVLVPERRGFGKSEGPTVAQEVGGSHRNEKQVRRSQAETDDVLAALDVVKGDPSINMKQLAVMGYSLGGQVAVFAASRSDAFAAVINQAGGSLSWNGNPLLQQALVSAARKIRIPSLSMVAENDATTDAVKRVHEVARAAGSAAELIVYPPFKPSAAVAGSAPGHALFQPEGVPIWGPDVVAFLRRELHAR